MDQIVEIQKKLKAPKGQWNDFSKFHYRSCEDIVEAVKPLLHEKGLHLVLSDELVNFGDRFYVKATAVVKDGEKVLGAASGFAREQEEKKGMDAAQITGSASSYARKYALNGLFAIDDEKDPDSKDNRDAKPQQQPQADIEKPWFNDDDLEPLIDKMKERIAGGQHPDDIVKNLRNTFKVSKVMAAKIHKLGEEIAA